MSAPHTCDERCEALRDYMISVKLRFETFLRCCTPDELQLLLAHCESDTPLVAGMIHREIEQRARRFVDQLAGGAS